MAEDQATLEAFLRPYRNRPQPAPFNKVALFEEILSAEECDAVIKLANQYGEEHGWTTHRHKRYPTTDIPVEVSWNSLCSTHADCQNVCKWVRNL